MRQVIRYHRAAIWLHWIIAVLILVMIPMGFLMEDAPKHVKLQVYQLHKTIGISILFLTLVRLGWRLCNRPPALEQGLKLWEKWAAKLTHGGFYVLMLGLPLSGWAVVSTSSKGIPTMLFGQLEWPHMFWLSALQAAEKKQQHHLFEEVHEYLVFAMIALFVLHVAAAIKHQMLDKGHTAARMVPGFMKKASAPIQKGRHGLVVTAIVAILFALWIIAGPMAAKARVGDVQSAPMATSAQMAMANWQVDHANSILGFSYSQNGVTGSGVFENWTASIFFDPEDLENAKIEVLVQMGSAKTGDYENDTSLQGAGWLNPAVHPVARWQSKNIIKQSDGTYSASGTLQMRGLSLALPVHFSLQTSRKKAQELAIAKGTTKLERLAFGVGKADDADAEWVANHVAVHFTLQASSHTKRS